MVKFRAFIDCAPKQHYCKFCEKTFNSSVLRNNHMQHRHDHLIYHCTISTCDKHRLFTKDEITAHAARRHAECVYRISKSSRCLVPQAGNTRTSTATRDRAADYNNTIAEENQAEKRVVGPHETRPDIGRGRTHENHPVHCPRCPSAHRSREDLDSHSQKRHPALFHDIPRPTITTTTTFAPTHVRCTWCSRRMHVPSLSAHSAVCGKLEEEIRRLEGEMFKGGTCKLKQDGEVVQLPPPSREVKRLLLSLMMKKGLSSGGGNGDAGRKREVIVID